MIIIRAPLFERGIALQSSMVHREMAGVNAALLHDLVVAMFVPSERTPRGRMEVLRPARLRKGRACHPAAPCHLRVAVLVAALGLD